ncbi:MMPL family transporter [Paenibacillus puldeungensis]|uniref:MMPL family transporter n=1 Tax=Paenibacillus puldeungensis TaxID=696536 RepID=A0ABW3RUM7_9BACL
MNKLINKSWISIILWGVILTVVLVTMPDMGKLVRDKGQAEIDANYSYSIAQNILKELDHVSKDDNVLDTIMVYHNKEKLSQENFNLIKEKVSNLESNKEKYGVKKVLNVFTNKDLEDQVISEDKTTLLVPISIEKQDRTVDEIREKISSLLKVDGVECYSKARILFWRTL